MFKTYFICSYQCIALSGALSSSAINPIVWYFPFYPSFCPYCPILLQSSYLPPIVTVLLQYQSFITWFHTVFNCNTLFLMFLHKKIVWVILLYSKPHGSSRYRKRYTVCPQEQMRCENLASLLLAPKVCGDITLEVIDFLKKATLECSS